MKSNSFIPLYMLPTINKALAESERFIPSSTMSQFQAICKIGSFVCITLALGWSIQALIKNQSRR